jgi:hypothetical protein
VPFVVVIIMGFSLYCLIVSCVLFTNAVAIINERFLRRFGVSGGTQRESKGTGKTDELMHELAWKLMDGPVLVALLSALLFVRSVGEARSGCASVGPQSHSHTPLRRCQAVVANAAHLDQHRCHIDGDRRGIESEATTPPLDAPDAALTAEHDSLSSSSPFAFSAASLFLSLAAPSSWCPLLNIVAH